MVAIIDYKAGNLQSVSNALSKLGYENKITADADEIRNAERVIFPGVGAANSAMKNLKEAKLDVILKEVIASGKPVLGICLGTQIILGYSEEDGGVECLNIIPGKAIRFNKEEDMKIPHMGWNQVNYDESSKHPIFNGLKNNLEFYFVHSFYPAPENSDNVVATTTYGSQKFCCAMQKGNLISTQFHPEKSGDIGLKLLDNFCKWNPSKLEDASC